MASIKEENSRRKMYSKALNESDVTLKRQQTWKAKEQKYLSNESIGKTFFNCNFTIVYHHILSTPAPIATCRPTAKRKREREKIVQFRRLFMQVVAVIKMEKKRFSWLCVKVFQQSADEASNESFRFLFSVVTECAHERRNNFLSDYVCLYHVQLFFLHPDDDGDDIDVEK